MDLLLMALGASSPLSCWWTLDARVCVAGRYCARTRPAARPSSRVRVCDQPHGDFLRRDIRRRDVRLVCAFIDDANGATSCDRRVRVLPRGEGLGHRTGYWL